MTNVRTGNEVTSRSVFARWFTVASNCWNPRLVLDEETDSVEVEVKSVVVCGSLGRRKSNRGQQGRPRNCPIPFIHALSLRTKVDRKELPQARFRKFQRFLQALLHQHCAKPATKLEADLAQVPVMLEAKSFMQSDRRLGTLV